MNDLAKHLSVVKFAGHRAHRGGHASKARGAAKRAYNRAHRRAGKAAAWAPVVDTTDRRIIRGYGPVSE